MNDPLPPSLPPAAAQHPGPPTGWRPMSGLAVASFVLSLLFVLLAVPGIWISELIPLGLGVLTLATVKPNLRRGRVLAVWAIVVAVGVGSCSYAMHSNVRSTLAHMAESVLSALSADSSDTEKDAALRPWMLKTSLEEDAELLNKIRARYRAAVDAFGPYQGSVELGTPFLGFAPLFFQPEGLAEIGSGEKVPEWKPGSVIWVTVPFEKGSARMALRIGSGDEEGMRGIAEAQDGDQAAIVSDVRFFQDAAPAEPGGP